METVPGSSKIKENLARVKALLEYRLFLSAVGVSNFEKNSRLDEICSFYGYKPNDLRELLNQSYDSRSYSKKEIEETMNIHLLDLIPDVAYGSQVIDSIFSLNPFA